MVARVAGLIFVQFWPASFLPMTLRPPFAVAQPPGLVRMAVRCSAVMPSQPSDVAGGMASDGCADSLRWLGADLDCSGAVGA